MTKIRLPTSQGWAEDFELPAPGNWETANSDTELSRIALSAGHVVVNPRATDIATIDWDATLAYRHYLWDLGLGVAEAMDTAQRGMGLDWPGARELIARTLKEAEGRKGAQVFSGIGTEQLEPAGASVESVIGAYRQQLDVVQSLGGRAIIMASRALARTAKGPEDYARVYEQVLGDLDQPGILHWLGPMFDPALEGYWGDDNISAAMDACLDVIAHNADKVDGIKISLLDKELEIAMRRRLPQGVKMYTGDDFNYAELIGGDEQGFSHALLGIFDPIAPAASAALLALSREDHETFNEILAPTVPLSRRLFEAPTRFYKTGVVFLAYLNGHQDHFVMLDGQQSARSLPHLVDIFRLAAQAGVLSDPELACKRMQYLLNLYGIEAMA